MTSITRTTAYTVVLKEHCANRVAVLLDCGGLSL